MRIEYVHVDVFSDVPYSGNSVPVFLDVGGLVPEQMLRITQELRHFEAIFLAPTWHTNRTNTVQAQVFDLVEELPFAGHPVIGAAAVLHQASRRKEPQTWRVELPGKAVSITTERTARGYFGWLDQGAPEYFGSVDARDSRDAWARAFDLNPSDLHSELPLEVISTGLRYLVIPVRAGALERARVLNNLTEALRQIDAQFAVLLDEAALEVRHWNNDGRIEDVATGSAAGTVGAYRLRHGLAHADEPFILRQGRFTGRPSTLLVQPDGTSTVVRAVKVGGDVAFVGCGVLEVVP